VELVREYLELDLAAREKECGECEAPDVGRDEDGYCSICKLKPLLEKFSWYFRAWVENLQRLYVWCKAGYQIRTGCSILTSGRRWR
jgi:hypothetical protein